MGKPSIWKSRKFGIMVWDTIVSLVLTVGAVYFFPQVKELIVTLIGILQAPVLFVIGAIAYEDKAAMASQIQKYIIDSQYTASVGQKPI